MSKTLIIVLVVSLLLLAGGGLAWAKYRGHCGHGPERMVNHLSKKLALDETQQQKLQLLGTSLSEMRGQWREKRQGTRDQVLELLKAADFDRDKAAQILDERAEKLRLKGQDLLQQFADFSDSLSLKQRQQLAGMVESRTGRYWHRHSDDD